jgi:hypothetical protein
MMNALIKRRYDDMYMQSMRDYSHGPVSDSSGMVANSLRTCFKAGRRIGLLGKIVSIKNSIGVLFEHPPDKHVHSAVHAVLDIALFCEST